MSTKTAIFIVTIVYLLCLVFGLVRNSKLIY